MQKVTLQTGRNKKERARQKVIMKGHLTAANKPVRLISSKVYGNQGEEGDDTIKPCNKCLRFGSVFEVKESRKCDRDLNELIRPSGSRIQIWTGNFGGDGRPKNLLGSSAHNSLSAFVLAKQTMNSVNRRECSVR